MYITAPTLDPSSRRYVHGAAVIAAVVSMACAPALAAVTIAVTTQRHEEFIEIHARAMLQADAATAWRVLTDYARYCEFIPDLRVSRVIARNGGNVTVEQAGDATLWLFRMPLEVTFEISEHPPLSLQSHAVAGSLRALESRYVLTPESTGVYLDYTGRVMPGYALFGNIEQYAVRQNIMRQFQALADEIERNGAAARLTSSTH